MKNNRRFKDRPTRVNEPRARAGERETPTVRQPSSLTYGLLPVLEMLRANPRRIDRIVIAEGAREHRLREITELAREHGIRVERLPSERFDRLAPDVNHQGVVAYAASADYAAADDVIDKAREVPLFVLLDGVEDPRNFGAILRTAECAGSDGVFIPERRAVGLTDTVAKSSAGATEYVKVAKVQNEPPHRRAERT